MVDTMTGYMLARAAQFRGAKRKVFDWHKAADIIKDRNLKDADAGLSGDLGSTRGEILREGMPVDDDYTYLASVWADPVLIVDGEEIECWSYEDALPEPWDSGTKWPDSARARL